MVMLLYYWNYDSWLRVLLWTCCDCSLALELQWLNVQFFVPSHPSFCKYTSEYPSLAIWATSAFRNQVFTHRPLIYFLHFHFPALSHDYWSESLCFCTRSTRRKQDRIYRPSRLRWTSRSPRTSRVRRSPWASWTSWILWLFSVCRYSLQRARIRRYVSSARDALARCYDMNIKKTSQKC